MRESPHSGSFPTHDMRPDKQKKRDFPGRRWLAIALRSLHLAGVVLVGATLLGGSGDHTIAAALMLVTGLALYGLDLWADPAHAGELAGIFIPLKLLVVLGMILQPEMALPLFWGLLLASSVVSHAPGRVRHVRVWR